MEATVYIISQRAREGIGCDGPVGTLFRGGGVGTRTIQQRWHVSPVTSRESRVWGWCCPRPLWYWRKWSTGWGAACLHECRGGRGQQGWETRGWGTGASPTQSKGMESGAKGSSEEVCEAACEEAIPPSSQGTPGPLWFNQRLGGGMFTRNNRLS